MTEPATPRRVHARRLVMLSAVAASIAAPALADQHSAPQSDGGNYLLAQAEGGEGSEGGGSAIAGDVALLRDLGFMTGHLRAGMMLYEAGDLDAAKTHMGHPIKEKYDAVSGPLDTLGLGGLRADLVALSQAAEAEGPADDVHAQFDKVLSGVAQARDATDASARQQILALSELMRIAGAEYAVAVEGGAVSNLHEYQDSWGFLQTIRSEGAAFAASDDPEVAEAGAEIAQIVDEVLGQPFGDIQGADIPAMDPSLLHGGAARIELVAYSLS